MEERIVAAAIQVNGMTISMPPLARHGTIIKQFDLTTNQGPHVYPNMQGFITSTGRFVNRIEGMAIAVAAQQLLPFEPVHRELFSENLW